MPNAYLYLKLFTKCGLLEPHRPQTQTGRITGNTSKLGLLALAALGLTAVSSAQLADSPWPKFHANLQNTGQSRARATTPNLKWGAMPAIDYENVICPGSPAIGEDGTVYVGAYWDGNLYAFDPTTGATKWTFQTGGAIECSPVVDSAGTIYIGADNGTFYALYPNGTLKWALPSLPYYTLSSPTIGPDGTIYMLLGTPDNFGPTNVEALNPADGSLEWEYSSSYSYTNGSTPAFSNGNLYISGFNYVFALSSTGTFEWATSVLSGQEAGILSSPAVSPDGSIMVGSGDGKVYALNPADGSMKWSFTTGGEVDSSPAIGPDGTVYVGSTDDNVYAISSNGLEKWAFTTGDWVLSSPAIGADGTIYVGSNDGNLYAINGTSGESIWVYGAGFDGDVASSPAIGSDGSLYVGVGWGYYSGSEQSFAPYGFIALSPISPIANELTLSGRLVGDTHFTLGVSGSNFEPGAVVTWNGRR